MGFFGGGGDTGGQQSKSDELIDQQFKHNQAELEQKRKNLYQERLDIIKGQGGQTWTPKR